MQSYMTHKLGGVGDYFNLISSYFGSPNRLIFCQQLKYLVYNIEVIQRLTYSMILDLSLNRNRNISRGIKIIGQGSEIIILKRDAILQNAIIICFAG